MNERKTAPSAEFVAGNRQSRRAGCYGCGRSNHYPFKGWKCDAGVTKEQGYPNLSKQNCFWYQKGKK